MGVGDSSATVGGSMPGLSGCAGVTAEASGEAEAIGGTAGAERAGVAELTTGLFPLVAETGTSGGTIAGLSGRAGVGTGVSGEAETTCGATGDAAAGAGASGVELAGWVGASAGGGITTAAFPLGAGGAARGALGGGAACGVGTSVT